MKRDIFLKNSLLAGAAMVSGFVKTAAADTLKGEKPFKMKFSPEFNIFADAGGKDPVDQIKWGYDQGFRA